MNVDFEKSNGLVPAIIQDERSGDVLMLGFMNAESLEETQRSREVVFFSRSRNRLWKKGESSRSEEHTSELQSRLHLVCRLLLEKKKTTSYTHARPVPHDRLL